MGSAGDMPSDERVSGSQRRNLTAVLMGQSLSDAIGDTKKPGAPWSNRPTNNADPRAASIQQGNVPQWIKPDAHLCYLSKSTGKVMEVIVEMVNTAKGEVEITFASDSSVWKVIPFSL